jgi:hypothetical protein
MTTRNKYGSVIIFTIFLLSVIGRTYAQSPTRGKTTPTITSNKTDTKQLDDLKDRLATKVAELREVVKRAVYGTVTSVSLTGATLDTTTKNLKIEFDDTVKVAQYINGKRTDLTTENLTKNDKATIFGSYDATLELLKASVIFIEDKQEIIHVSGKVTDVNNKNFTVTITTPENRTVIVDIEKSTKTFSWTASDGEVKSGFSKIAVGDTVHITGVTDPKQDTHISAARFLDIGNLSGTASPTATETIQPTQSIKPTLNATPKSTSAPSATP